MRRAILAGLWCLLMVGCEQRESGSPPDEPDTAASRENATVESPAPEQPVMAAPSSPDVVSSPPRVSARPDFRPLATGLGIFDSFLRVSTRAVAFHVVAVDPQSREVQLVAETRPKSPGISVQNFLRQAGGLAALSGGFLKSFYPALPLGYVQTSGEPRNRGHETDLLNGLLALRPGNVDILPTSAVPDKFEALTTRWRDVLQSGPLLVMNGTVVVQSRDSRAGSTVQIDRSRDRDLVHGQHLRAFVAVGCGNDILLGLSGEISLPELADILQRSSREGGFGCEAALNLSGAESAGLVIDAGNTRQSFGGVDFRIANALIVL